MKKIILLIAIFLLGGCYDYAEIDDLGIIVGLIIDYKDNKYEITSQILEQKNETKIKLYKTTCNQIDECLSDISKQASKEIFISHLKILLLTENTIKKDINYYDYFLRNPKSKMNFYIYYIDDTNILANNNSRYCLFFGSLPDCLIFLEIRFARSSGVRLLKNKSFSFNSLFFNAFI